MARPGASLSFIFWSALTFIWSADLSALWSVATCRDRRSTRIKGNGRQVAQDESADRSAHSKSVAASYDAWRPNRCHCKFMLLELKAARDHICLIANACEFVAQTRESQRIDGAIISLQVIDAAHHRLCGSDEFIRHGDAA